MRRPIHLAHIAIGIVLLFLVILVVVGAKNSPPPFHRGQDPRIAAFTNGMTFFSDVPATVPANGAALLDGSFALRPLTSTQAAQVSLTKDQAIAVAKSMGGQLPVAQALLASFTAIGTLPFPGDQGPVAKPIENVPAWVITFTRTTSVMHVGRFVPKGTPTPASSPPAQYYHLNVVINAETGKIVLGFDTP
jgi:hypothetical protein